jgi:hypothetical protein
LICFGGAEALSAEFIEKEGVEALTPLLGPANKELQKQAVRTIKNLSKSMFLRLPTSSYCARPAW